MLRLTRKGWDVAVTGLTYAVAVPVAVILGAKDWLEHGDRTGYVADIGGGIDEKETDRLFIKQGLFSKIAGHYRDAVR
jgi:hypothetical protein